MFPQLTALFLSRLSDGTSLAQLYIRASQSHLTSVFSCRAWNTVPQDALRSRDVKFNVTCKFYICNGPVFWNTATLL